MNSPSASAFSIKNNLFFIKKNLTDFKSEKNIIFHCALKIMRIFAVSKRKKYNN